MAVALLVIGAASEFAGIVLIGFPDFLPGAIRLSGWLRRQGRRAANLIRRLARRPPKPVVHKVGIDAAIGFEDAVVGVVGTGATTLEGQVEYLLRRDQDTQRELNALAARVRHLETESRRQLAEARQEMERHVDRELVAALEAYRPLRVVGTIALAVGLVCTTVATFLA